MTVALTMGVGAATGAAPAGGHVEGGITVIA